MGLGEMLIFVVGITISILVSFATIYLVVLSRWGWTVREESQNESICFAVLVPAHNEEDKLDELLDSLQCVQYPASKLIVRFVADHCTDRTVSILRSRGYAVLDRQEGSRGKAAALSAGVEWFLREQPALWDALVIFDADNVVDPLFFRYAAGKLAQGHRVVQGNAGIFNPDDTVFTMLNHVNFLATNRFKELARSQAGLSCRLRGHGMVFVRELVSHLAWDVPSAVEDQILWVQVLLSGERVEWSHAALVRSRIPNTTRDAAQQRARWVGEKAQIIREAIFPLLRAGLMRRQLTSLDAAIEFLLPSNAMVVAMNALLVIWGYVFSGRNVVIAWHAGLLLLFLAYFIGALFLERANTKYYRVIFSAPFFVFWRTVVFFRGLLGTKDWK